MENNMKKGLNKLELIIVIVAGLILALGLAAMIAGGYWVAKKQNQPISVVLLVFGVLWFITSPLLIIGIVNDYSKKVMMIFSIIALCTINAAGLASLLLITKKKKVAQQPVVTTAGIETTAPETEVKPEQPKVEEVKVEEVKPEQPKVGE